MHVPVTGVLRKTLALSLRDKGLLLRSAVLIVFIRASLHVLPFRRVVRILDMVGTSGLPPQNRDVEYVHRVAWLVSAVARRLVSDRPCLTQALAARLLLRRRGYSAALRIGVSKSPAGNLEAHAWLESGDIVVVGGSDAPLYFTPLPSLERHFT